MKAITLWQPWASAVATGAKKNETRSWATKHRGPLAIHAAARRVTSELIYYSSVWGWCGALDRRMGAGESFLDTLTFGAVIAVVDLIDCRPTDGYTVAELDTPRMSSLGTLYSWTERHMGDFAPGRFGWPFANVRALPQPVPCRGYQQIWNLSPEVEAAVQLQLELEATP